MSKRVYNCDDDEEEEEDEDMADLKRRRLEVVPPARKRKRVVFDDSYYNPVKRPRLEGGGPRQRFLAAMSSRQQRRSSFVPGGPRVPNELWRENVMPFLDRTVGWNYVSSPMTGCFNRELAAQTLRRLIETIVSTLTRQDGQPNQGMRLAIRKVLPPGTGADEMLEAAARVIHEIGDEVSPEQFLEMYPTVVGAIREYLRAMKKTWERMKELAVDPYVGYEREAEASDLEMKKRYILTLLQYLVELREAAGACENYYITAGKYGGAVEEWDAGGFFDTLRDIGKSAMSVVRSVVRKVVGTESRMKQLTDKQLVEKKRWMELLPPNVRASVPFSRLALLGAHDSGTWAVSSSSDLAPDADGAIRKLYAASPTRPIISRWAKTQDLNFLQMLDFGVRYLDIRVAWVGGRELVCCHSLLGATFKDLTDALNQFYGEGSREVLVIDIQKCYDFNKDAMQALASACAGVGRSAFGSSFADTIDELVSQNHLIFWVLQDETYDKMPPKSRIGTFQRRSDVIVSNWHNEAEVDNLLPKISGAKAPPYDTTLWVAQGVLTPGTAEVAESVITGASLSTNIPSINSKIVGAWKGKYGVLMLDFVEQGTDAFWRY